MSNSSLALVQPSEWSMLMQMAEYLAASGFLPQSVSSPQKAVAIILAGRELGIAPWQSLSTINVIQGKPTISPQLMLALINRSGELADMTVEDDGQRCVVTMTRRGRTPHSEAFSMADAQAMGLAGKDNWKKQAPVMRKWRAVAACARVVFPDVILGLYTPEEMEADVRVTDDGGMEVVTPAAPVVHVDTEKAKALLGNGGPRRIDTNEPEAPVRTIDDATTRDWPKIFKACELMYPEDTEDARKGHWWGTVKKLQKAGRITEGMADKDIVDVVLAYKTAEPEAEPVAAFT